MLRSKIAEHGSLRHSARYPLLVWECQTQVQFPSQSHPPTPRDLQQHLVRCSLQRFVLDCADKRILPVHSTCPALQLTRMEGTHNVRVQDHGQECPIRWIDRGGYLRQKCRWPASGSAAKLPCVICTLVGNSIGDYIQKPTTGDAYGRNMRPNRKTDWAIREADTATHRL